MSMISTSQVQFHIQKRLEQRESFPIPDFPDFPDGLETSHWSLGNDQTSQTHSRASNGVEEEEIKRWKVGKRLAVAQIKPTAKLTAQQQ